MPLRNTASPPIEIASSDAPWKLSHKRQRLVAAGGEPRELQRHADRERSARREQHLAERIGRERRELARRAPRPRRS